MNKPVAATQTCEQLLERFLSVRRQTEKLVAPLSAEDCALQSMPDASPAKWHLGHTSWFFETFVLEQHAADFAPFRPEFRLLFNSYYVGVGPRHPRPERGLLSRPALDEVLAYRASVDERIANLLSGTRDGWHGCVDLIELGLQHEQQHQELLLTDLKHLLSRNPTNPVYDAAAAAGPAGAALPLGWIRLTEGVHRIGHTGSGFCFDNEQPAHRVFIGRVELADRTVTNAEYLAFIDDGGYERPELWLSEGWDVKCAQGWRAPLYWQQDGEGSWSVFTLGGMKPVASAEPVTHLSYYEADAYARWTGYRLPGETEWEVCAAGRPSQGNFVESGRCHPAPAARTGQFFGDVWQWTSSTYGPYPGFRSAPGAIGEYNGKFMVNQYVLRGGSCATPRSHIRASYRNFFPAAARWQFSGVRLARDLD
jgi:ergothioneine biosynthesis protein EgtB